MPEATRTAGSDKTEGPASVLGASGVVALGVGFRLIGFRIGFGFKSLGFRFRAFSGLGLCVSGSVWW